MSDITSHLRERQLGRELAGSSGDSDSQSREEARAFLQQRVAALGLLLAAIFGMFFVWRLVSTFAFHDGPSGAYLPWQALTVVACLGMWQVGRGRARSERALRATELVGLSVAAAAAIRMCFQISYTARPDVVLLLCLTYTLIMRAIMVPSSARRTLGYGLFFFVPFLVSVYFLHATQHDPGIYTDQADARLRQDAQTLARRWSLVGALWWVAAIAISTATSKVIYGLHKQVRDARRLGQYTLVEKLGEGGMGVVYLARHALLRRPSAIKLLPPTRFSNEGAQRFEREVQLTASLSHPNTVRVFDYGRTPDGIFYYVMEYLSGAGLDHVVAVTGPLPAARVIHILDQVAGALGEAHAVGLIHRDIKPANIFLTEQGGMPDVAKVLDFGLVKQLREVRGNALTAPGMSEDRTISGTPTYMAPEAILTPERVDARTDLYALGAVGYYLLTGQEVFSGETVIEVCAHHLHSVPPPPSQRTERPIPADLEQLILRCLQKSATDRIGDARAFREALRTCQDAGSWSEAEARDWFALHASALRARRPRSSVSGSTTVAVDLGLRGAPAHATPERNVS